MVVAEALAAQAAVDLAHLPVLAPVQAVARRVRLPLAAGRPLLRLGRAAHLPVPELPVPVLVAPAVPVLPVLAGPRVRADVVVEPEVLRHLRSRPSCSLAWARSTPWRVPPTYEPVRRSR